MLTYILMMLGILAAIVVVVLPILLWRALTETSVKDDASAAQPQPLGLSFHDKSIWRAFLSWRRTRPAQLEHRQED